jgi:ATP-dependent Clp protease ATP-binding subunit ClpC
MLALVFERFTDRARRVVVLAQEESRMLDHDYIGTEHLLLGLIREGEGVAAQVLESMDISLAVVRQQVEEIIGRGGKAGPTGHIPFTPRAKKVMELSLREALALGHNYIGTEHLLLGLIREGEGVAAQVLEKMGADLNSVRQAVVGLLSSRGIKVEPAAQETFSSESPEEERPGPKCPRCGSDLAVYATYRSITVPDEAETGGRKILFVFCKSCSYTLGTIAG